MHRVSNVAMKVVATATMQAATLNTVYSIGNGISEGLTGESLHGVGLAATSIIATGAAFGVGIRTYTAVDDGLKMIDDYRMQKAQEEFHSLESMDFSEDPNEA